MRNDITASDQQQQSMMKAYIMFPEERETVMQGLDNIEVFTPRIK